MYDLFQRYKGRPIYICHATMCSYLHGKEKLFISQWFHFWSGIYSTEYFYAGDQMKSVCQPFKGFVKIKIGLLSIYLSVQPSVFSF